MNNITALRLELGERSYDITVGRGLLSHADRYLDLDRRVLIVTDSGVPERYAREVASCAREARILTVPMGEGSKSLEVLETVLKTMTDMNMTRRDCAIAVGGGVVGDLTGFAAAVYMRGIDFYNLPTTLLSQVDSSIGGKTAVNLGGIKNVVGAFHQPRAVLIDTDTLATLPERQLANGICEAVKMAATSNEVYFRLLEQMSKEEIYENVHDVIVEALKIKRDVVEKDERESGLRKILNFGHTLGHGIEAESDMSELYHGECVALGMLPVCSDDARARLTAVLDKLGLPTRYHGDIDAALGFVSHDKKMSGDMLDVIYVERIGECEVRRMTADEFSKLVKEIY